MPACRPFALRFVLAPLLALAAGLEAPREAAAQDGMPSRLRFEVRYARDLHEGPLTGRLFLAFSPTAEPEPRIRIYNPEMDQFYLSYAVYLLEEFLEGNDGSALRRRGGPWPAHEGPPLVAVHQRGARAPHGGSCGRERSARRVERVVRATMNAAVGRRCRAAGG